MANNLKYHDILVDYFRFKSDEFDPLNWDKCSNRILTELPFQYLHSASSQLVANILCNPMFLGASILGGLLYNLIDDINTSIDIAKIKHIIPIRDSILNGISAIKARPTLSICIIVNRLINVDVDLVTKNFLKIVLNKLDEKGEWLCAKTNFPNIQYIDGIININTFKRKYYVKSNSDEVDVCNLDTHKKTKQIKINSNSYELSIHPQSEKIASLSINGDLYIDSYSLNINLKPDTTIFSWFGTGLIGLDKLGFLIFINIENTKEFKIWNNTIKPFSTIAVSHSTNTAIIISGDRPNDQIILHIKFLNGIPVCTKLQLDNVFIYKVCLDQNGEYALFSTWSRELLLINLYSKEIRKISTRIADGFSIRGKIKDLYLFTYPINQIAVFATDVGELLLWDTSSDILRRKGTYKGLMQSLSIQSISIIPEEDKIILATNLFLETTSIYNENMLSPKSGITHCCITEDRSFVILNENEKKVIWCKDGKFIYEFSNYNFSPSSITSIGKDGIVAIGYKHGLVAIVCPDKLICEFNACLNGEPIISVLPYDDDRILSVNKYGHISIANINNLKDYQVIKGIESLKNVFIVSRLGKRNDLIIGGVNNVGSILFTAYVIREDDKREFIFESREKVLNIVSNEDGAKIYVIFTYRIDCYEYRYYKWTLVVEHKKEILAVSTCINNQFAIVLKEDGLNWLELCSIDKNINIICLMELPAEISAICSFSNLIGLGTQDGNSLLIEIRNNH